MIIRRLSCKRVTQCDSKIFNKRNTIFQIIETSQVDFIIYANKLSIETGMENVIAIPTKTGMFDFVIYFNEYMTVTMTDSNISYLVQSEYLFIQI